MSRFNKAKDKVFVLFCPRCYSQDVNRELSRTYGNHRTAINKCNKCNYQSYSFPEGDPKDIPEVKEVDKWDGKVPKNKGDTLPFLLLSLIMLPIFIYGLINVESQNKKIFFGVLILIFVLIFVIAKRKESYLRK